MNGTSQFRWNLRTLKKKKFFPYINYFFNDQNLSNIVFKIEVR